MNHVKTEITALARKVCSGLNIKNNSDKKTIKLNKRVYLDPEFKNLWDRIKYKTTYSVDFDSEKLIDECCKEMQNSLSVSSAKTYLYEGWA
jgi:type III restriction enzyme